MPSTRQSAARKARNARSYEERSNSESSNSDEIASPRKRRRFSDSHSPATTLIRKQPSRLIKNAINHKPPSGPSKRSEKHIKENERPQTMSQKVETDGIIPNWASLPYEILLTILRYASHPLRDENQLPNGSIGWLLNSARLCKSFAAPALAALYENPPLFTVDKCHRLFELLHEDDNSHFINYKPKIKCVELDSKLALSNPAANRVSFDLSMLIPLLPRLAAIDISNGCNRPPFRRIGTKDNRRYSSRLFDTMQNSGTKLRSWRWHGDMMTNDIGGLKDIHSRAFFNNIKRLSLSHLVLLPDGVVSTRRQKAAIQADILMSLPQLTELCFESCQSETWDMLKHIPNLLVSFEAINCPTFDDESLLIFLVDNGKGLKHLILNHNRSLSLAFSPQLKACCPELETLYMDFTYYSASVLGDLHHRSDSEPSYDSLIQPGNIPTWPTKLQELSLLHLRKWSSEVASGFFQSLLFAAPELSQLRDISIKAILNISWRERAIFREKWINDLNSAFLRKSRPPNVHLASTKAFRLWKEKYHGKDVRPPKRSISGKEATHAGDGGTCSIVDISIDNMRPSEVRFREEDFMDSEAGGDEEWTGDNEVEVPIRYAW